MGALEETLIAMWTLALFFGLCFVLVASSILYSDILDIFNSKFEYLKIHTDVHGDMKRYSCYRQGSSIKPVININKQLQLFNDEKASVPNVVVRIEDAMKQLELLYSEKKAQKQKERDERERQRKDKSEKRRNKNNKVQDDTSEKAIDNNHDYCEDEDDDDLYDLDDENNHNIEKNQNECVQSLVVCMDSSVKSCLSAVNSCLEAMDKNKVSPDTNTTSSKSVHNDESDVEKGTSDTTEVRKAEPISSESENDNDKRKREEDRKKREEQERIEKEQERKEKEKRMVEKRALREQKAKKREEKAIQMKKQQEAEDKKKLEEFRRMHTVNRYVITPDIPFVMISYQSTLKRTEGGILCLRSLLQLQKELGYHYVWWDFLVIHPSYPYIQSDFEEAMMWATEQSNEIAVAWPHIQIAKDYLQRPWCVCELLAATKRDVHSIYSVSDEVHYRESPNVTTKIMIVKIAKGFFILFGALALSFSVSASGDNNNDSVDVDHQTNRFFAVFLTFLVILHIASRLALEQFKIYDLLEDHLKLQHPKAVIEYLVENRNTERKTVLSDLQSAHHLNGAMYDLSDAPGCARTMGISVPDYTFEQATMKLAERISKLKKWHGQSVSNMCFKGDCNEMMQFIGKKLSLQPRFSSQEHYLIKDCQREMQGDGSWLNDREGALEWGEILNITDEYCGRDILFASEPTDFSPYQACMKPRAYLPHRVRLVRPLLTGKHFHLVIVFYNILCTLLPIIITEIMFAIEDSADNIDAAAAFLAIFTLICNYVLLRLPYILMDFGYLTIVAGTKTVSDMYYMRQYQEIKCISFIAIGLTFKSLAFFGIMFVGLIVIPLGLTFYRHVLLSFDDDQQNKMDALSPMDKGISDDFQKDDNMYCKYLYSHNLAFPPIFEWILRCYWQLEEKHILTFERSSCLNEVRLSRRLIC